MKKIFILLYCFSFSYIDAQNKYDNIWLLGNSSSSSSMRITWSNIKPDTSFYKEVYINIGNPNASICSPSGRLMYFSNGCSIAGKNLTILSGSKEINPGWINDNYCGHGSVAGNSYPAFNNVLFLPNPEDSTRYYLFHANRIDYSYVPFFWFYYTELDSKVGTQGKIIKKNIQLGPVDSMSEMGPIACKHANGKDWWVVIPSVDNHTFFRTILTSEGPAYVGKQALKSAGQREKYDWAGQAVFSPNGKKYVRSDPFNGTFVYDFDRCTGLMSEPIFIDTLRSAACSGVAISPNSQYLYISNRDVLHQFDLNTQDVLASKVKIAERDTFLTSLGRHVPFYKSLLAPDGKIYIGGTGSIDWLSVIHQPDAKGIACDFRQHDLKLPSRYYVGLPNIPHFRMPAQEGVICPPIVASKEKITPEVLRIFPNPTSGQINIYSYALPNTKCTWTLLDNLGHQVFSQVLDNENISLSLPTSLPKGIYFWRVSNSTEALQQGKLVLLE